MGLTPGSWLDIDDTCRVKAVEDGWLYAAGDVNHRALLTHQGKYQGRIAGTAIGARAAGTLLDTEPRGRTSRPPITTRCRRHSSPTRRRPPSD